MTNDRELLELAAKAAGYEHRYDDGTHYIKDAGLWVIWNPRDDDGDALRLAIDLGLWVYFGKYGTSVDFNGHLTTETGRDKHAVARRAIVRAAAEIGRNTK